MSVAAMGFSPLHRPHFIGGNVAQGRVRFLSEADAALAQMFHRMDATKGNATEN